MILKYSLVLIFFILVAESLSKPVSKEDMLLHNITMAPQVLVESKEAEQFKSRESKNKWRCLKVRKLQRRLRKLLLQDKEILKGSTNNKQG